MTFDTELQDLNFNDFSSYKPLTLARAQLINYKNTAQLALLMLNEEGGECTSGLDLKLKTFTDF